MKEVERGEGRYINKIYSPKQKVETVILENSKTIEKKVNKRFRSDKTHNIKFPVDEVLYIKLKSLNRKANEHLKMARKKDIPQTQFNTKLLQFGLKNSQIINWNIKYKDSKRYMHTNILETEYEKIGGEYGYSVTKMCSDRKVVTIIIISVLKFIEERGNIHEIIQ